MCIHRQDSSGRALHQARQTRQANHSPTELFNQECLENVTITLRRCRQINEFNGLEQSEAGLHDYIRYFNYGRVQLKLKDLSPVRYLERFVFT